MTKKNLCGDKLLGSFDIFYTVLSYDVYRIVTFQPHTPSC